MHRLKDAGVIDDCVGCPGEEPQRDCGQCHLGQLNLDGLALLCLSVAQ